WREFLRRQVPKWLGAIRFGNFEVLSQGQVTAVVTAVLGRIGLVLGVLLVYGYLTVEFSLFPWSQTWSWYLLAFARDKLIAATLSFGRAIPQLIVIAVLVTLFRWLVKLSDRFFDAVHARTVRVSWLHQDLAAPTKRLVGVLLWVIGVAIAYPFIP